MPASFPTSAKTFTSRNSGDVIQPAHVNDLQDEVNAIETGLLNKTAQLALNSTLTIGVVPYVFPSSGGAVGSVLMASSTSGSTMVLAWQVPSGVLDRVTTQQDVVNTIAERSEERRVGKEWSYGGTPGD